MNDTLKCHRCDDVIGVYEPMIVLSNGHARETSRAAEPSGGSAQGDSYHRECYTLAYGVGPASRAARSGP